MAAYYPEVADFQHRRSARSLVQSIAKLYPCSHCKDDFAQAIDHHPPKCDTHQTGHERRDGSWVSADRRRGLRGVAWVGRVFTREEFAVWVCEQHNAVNEKIGKPTHPCRIELLDRRWRTGSAACQAQWATAVGDQDAGSSLGKEA